MFIISSQKKEQDKKEILKDGELVTDQGTKKLIEKEKPWAKDKEVKLTKNEFSNDPKNSSKINGSCNIDLLKQFGIKIKDEHLQIQRPFKSNSLIKSYCRRNVNSCCLAEEIIQLEKHFTQAKKQLQEKFQPLQEMIILFKGKRYEEFLFEVKQSDECYSILEKSNLYQEAKNEDHFMNVVLPIQIDRMFSLLNDSQIYLKKNYWFYGNMICVICNPNEVKNFHLDDKEPYIEYNINNCAEMIEISEFENRAIMAYENFFKVFVNLSQCITGNYQDDDYQVPDLDIETINKNLITYSFCYENFDFTSQRCQELCGNKNFDEYSFPINFFETIQQALKNLFPVFTGIELEEFYKNKKNKVLSTQGIDDSIIFFEDFKANKLIKAKTKIDTSTGIFIYQNQMSKKFYYYVNKKYDLKTFVRVIFIFWILN